MKNNRVKIFLTIVLSLIFICSALTLSSVIAFADSTVDFTVTGLNVVTLDGLNRMQIYLQTDYNGSFFNGAQNPSTRTNSANLTLTMEIDGKEFTYEAGKYVVTFGQNVGGVGELFLVLKTEEGNVNGSNASFYPSNYPGLAKNVAHTITMNAGTVIGAFKLSNDFTIKVDASGTSGMLISNPHEVSIENGTITGGTYILDEKVQANAGQTITFTTAISEGLVLDKVVLLKDDQTNADVAITENNGTYSFTMPNYNVKINVLQKEKTFALNCGGTILDIKPFAEIGTLPDGAWYVDGVEISEKSTYIWNTDKVATKNTGATVSFVLDDKVIWKQSYNPALSGADIKYPNIPAKDGYKASWEETEFNGGDKVIKAKYDLITYTATLYVDGEKFDTIEFNCLTDKIILPVIPYKDGYKIIGWDISKFPNQNVEIHAVYEILD